MEKKAAIRLDGTTGVQKAIKMRVSQGSQITPILFMLFTAPLFKLFSNEKKKASVTIRGYVDNRLITGWGSSEPMCISRLVEAFKEVEEWAYQNSMVFDSAKYKAVHFSKRRNFPNSPITLSDLPFLSDIMEPRVIKPISKRSSMH